MKLRYQFHFQQVGNTYVGAAIGADVRRFNGILQLNETGHFIVSRLTEDTTREALIAALLTEYNSDLTTATQYVDDVINYLGKEGVLLHNGG